MQQEIERLEHPVLLNCDRCNYKWVYGGKSPYYATCPYCRHQVNIKKYTISQTSPQVRGPEESAIPVTKEAVEPIG